MPLNSGTRLGTYEIVGPLGAGGMGEVYRATDTRLGRDVAIKVLPGDVTASPDRLARLEREARTVAALNHPNVVTLYSVEDEDGVRFLTMELVDGQSLDRVLVTGGLPLARVLELSIPLAAALVAAHERGVVHRDLKPGNVMITRDGWVKVLDFGLAKAATATTGVALDAATIAATEVVSAEGRVVGTVPYMAPEQVRGGVVDARSDLFALGIIVYELATGKRPFTGESSADVSSAILRDIPVPAIRLRADLPRELDRIIARCLEKDPRDRIQTARDVYNELRYIQRELGQAAVSTPTAPPAAAPAPPAPSSPPVTPWPGPSATSTSSSESRRAAAREAPSIAVLPFVNRSREEEDEYFSDGLADELLNMLTKVRGLRVAARASSFQFRGKNEDLAVIGERLNVATLLDGSVRKAGNRVRISVQLVQAADRVQLWSETYDRSLDDVFAVQDDIAQSVVKELRSTLLGVPPDSDASGRARADVAAVVMGHGENVEAHRLYLQGKYFCDRLTGADTERAITYLKQAVALDPSHAAAWCALSRAHAHSGSFGWGDVRDEFRDARATAIRALELAPDLAEAHVALSVVQRWHDWDWRAAEHSSRRALELAPENAEALHSYGWLCMHLGRFGEAETLMRHSIGNDPLNVEGYVGIGMLYRAMNRNADAERALKTAIEIIPQASHTRYALALLLAEEGRDDDALAVARDEPTTWGRLTGAAYAHARAGRQAESEAAMRELQALHGVDAQFQLAQVCAARGDVDAAFEWLERGFKARDPGMAWTKYDAALEPLHADPRWADLMARLDLGD